MKLQQDLREFVELLNSHSVEYIIIGGHAVAFHGYPRFTGDIDLFIRPTLDNGKRLIRVLEAFGFSNTGIDAETFTQANKVVQMGRPPNRIDLLTSISGVDFEEVWKGRVSGKLDGIPVFFIGRLELKRNKRASARAKDLADLEKL